MKTNINHYLFLLSFFFLGLNACKKDRVTTPTPNTPGSQQHGNGVLKIRASVQVGDIVYDSITAGFVLTSWDSLGTAYQKDTILAAGTQGISFPASHIKFSVQMKKWGAVKDSSILNTVGNLEKVLVLKAVKQAKLLKEEITYNYVSGAFKPIAKSNYAYTNNRLSEITFYQSFLKDGIEVFEAVKKEQFSYIANLLASTRETFLKNVGTEPAVQAYTYNNEKKLVKTIVFYPSKTYTYKNEYSGTEPGLVNITEETNNMPDHLHFQARFENGNLVSTRTHTAGIITGNNYQYDQQVNPYLHLQWPDLLFKRQSKNNVSGEWFYNGVNSVEVARYEYEYDNDGFITQLIKREKDPISGNFTIQSKKIFIY